MNMKVTKRKVGIMRIKNLMLILIVGIIMVGYKMDESVYAAQDKSSVKIEYTFPKENEQHEGTWLIWPHKYSYGEKYQKELEPIWIKMTKALAPGEKVHIVAYNRQEQARIAKILEVNGILMKQITFMIAKTNDVWARDMGPIFVYDRQHNLRILNFNFNGWGRKEKYNYDNKLAVKIAHDIKIPVVNVPKLTLEGGAVELDGNGALMATKSAILNKNRNPGMTEAQADQYFKKYFGVTDSIWLDGVKGQDITDDHIDGFARFYDNHTILTVPEKDFLELYENNPKSDYQKLETAKNDEGQPYHLKTIPLTKNNVRGLDYKGSYLNYYIGNKVILLPVYNDPNDQIVINKMKELYPNKDIVPINVDKLYKNGGMLHYVTQQQPFDKQK